MENYYIVDLDNKNIKGGISGAISEPLSPEAIKHAIKYYEEIRHRTDDIIKIAEYTGYTPEQILKVKNYLFMETHFLETGIKRFDPCFEIAETWQRLADMQEFVQPHDRLLIPHELMEMKLVTNGMRQKEAHKKTCEKYDYPKETSQFYNKLQKEKRARLGKGAIISGALNHKEREDWGMRL